MRAFVGTGWRSLSLRLSRGQLREDPVRSAARQRLALVGLLGRERLEGLAATLFDRVALRRRRLAVDQVLLSLVEEHGHPALSLSRALDVDQVLEAREPAVLDFAPADAVAGQLTDHVELGEV